MGFGVGCSQWGFQAEHYIELESAIAGSASGCVSLVLSNNMISMLYYSGLDRLLNVQRQKRQSILLHYTGLWTHHD